MISLHDESHFLSALVRTIVTTKDLIIKINAMMMTTTMMMKTNAFYRTDDALAILTRKLLQLFGRVLAAILAEEGDDARGH